MKRIILFIFFFAAVPFNPLQAGIIQKDGAQFPSDINYQGQAFHVQGLGAKYFLFIKVFVAGFYTGEAKLPIDPLGDIAKKIEVAYFHPVPARKLAIETRRRMIANISPLEYSRIKSRVDVMDGYFVDIKPGDRYSLLYVPGKGTSFIYNGLLRGQIEGADFARALFAVWVGKYPIDQNLRKDLLSIQTGM